MPETTMTLTTKIERRDAVRRILTNRGETIIVCGLGSSTYDVFAAGDDDRNFYLWGAMGGAVMIGLGLAIAQPDKPVLVITGDGEALMGMGALASVAAQNPKNLTIIVLDNAHFGETGMQPSHTAHGVELAEVATACGFESTQTIVDYDSLDAYSNTPNAANGPRLAVVKITTNNPDRALPNLDGIYIKNRLRSSLGFQPV
jgi:thiamine pyrophosphate-dependent acetolactate synthase large subunit-like protein